MSYLVFLISSLILMVSWSFCRPQPRYYLWLHSLFLSRIFHKNSCLSSRLRPILHTKDVKTLVHAFNSSRLDYCTALSSGLRVKTIQNSAPGFALILRSHHTSLLSCSGSTGYLFHIVLLITFKALHGLANSHTTDLVHPYTPSRSYYSHHVTSWPRSAAGLSAQ